MTKVHKQHLPIMAGNRLWKIKDIKDSNSAKINKAEHPDDMHNLACLNDNSCKVWLKSVVQYLMSCADKLEY